MSEWWEGAVPATLEEVLDARERRAAEQRRMREEYGCTVLSFTLNLPGHFKRYPLADRAFEDARAAILNLLRQCGWEVLERREEADNAGCQLLLAVEADAFALKGETVRLEETAPLGRLYDIDVIDEGGNAIRREDVGVAGRRCILCGGPVALCVGGRSHSLEELAEAAARLLAADDREGKRR